MSLGFLAVSAAHCRRNVSPRTLSGSEYMRRLTTGREQSWGAHGAQGALRGGPDPPRGPGGESVFPGVEGLRSSGSVLARTLLLPRPLLLPPSSYFLAVTSG